MSSEIRSVIYWASVKPMNGKERHQGDRYPDNPISQFTFRYLIFKIEFRWEKSFCRAPLLLLLFNVTI